ncbi:MORN repeat-containing protein 3 isoform X2 [Cephus cinctus]|uniref:MORN repeat-containing protein 3 n=1 Tax=Cephus cinctus TaxID=211228 RepID=A0AAJ7BTZ7_CEPCN|nr:MORN repeat-containing protein 3 isoform X2 [Cephus cinctus]
MPISKTIKTNRITARDKLSDRNGWRHSIYSPSAPAKDYYKGQWKDDKKEGKGTEFTRYNWLYEGDWLNGLKHGYGTLSRTAKDGTTFKSYTGNWLHGMKHGFGGHWYQNGDYYEGTFQKNKKHGFGHMSYGTKAFYRGMWMDDYPHGKGVLNQANGNTYDGQFFNGKKQGYGVFYHFDTGQLQEGVWDNDICLTSTMKDICWRQSAIHPTPYPIPILQLQS